MVGSPLVASWIALWGFWVLLVLGWTRGALAYQRGMIFICLWVAGFIGLRYVPYVGSLFSPYVAILDIALVFIIFKGDVRLT